MLSIYQADHDPGPDEFFSHLSNTKIPINPQRFFFPFNCFEQLILLARSPTSPFYDLSTLSYVSFTYNVRKPLETLVAQQALIGLILISILVSCCRSRTDGPFDTIKDFNKQ